METSYSKAIEHLSSGKWHMNVTRKHGKIRYATLVQEGPTVTFLRIHSDTAQKLVAHCKAMDETESGSLTYQKYRYKSQKEVKST